VSLTSHKLSVLRNNLASHHRDHGPSLDGEALIRCVVGTIAKMLMRQD
jgi:hypothetical protein